MFNSAPDNGMSGGLDSEGNHYHRVMFNDNTLGHSWRRADGINTVQYEIDCSLLQTIGGLINATRHQQ